MVERLVNGFLIKIEKTNLVDGRSSESNRRKERDMADNSDQGEWGTTEYNITTRVRTEEEGG